MAIKDVFTYFVTLFSLISPLVTKVGAQNIRDRNWDSEHPVFFEDFNTPGQELDGFFLPPDYKMCAFAPERWPCGVVFDYVVTRPQQWHFSPEESCVKIVAEYAGHLIEREDFDVPDNFPCNESLQSYLYYYSGNIEVIPPFHYGHFEIRCKLPTHKGAFPSFWLWGCGPHSYEEIDIFEYTWSLFKEDLSEREIGRRYTIGIWYNPDACLFTFPFVIDNNRQYNPMNIPRGRIFPLISEREPSLDEWHTFSCEWTPNYVRWYLNGSLTNVVHGQEKIPQNPMALKVNYSIDSTALYTDYTPNWMGSDIMTVDYIKVTSLKLDCDTDEQITRTEELEHFEYKVKHSIQFGNGEEPLVFPEHFNDTFRATSGMVFKGPVVIPMGSKVSFSMSDCGY